MRLVFAHDTIMTHDNKGNVYSGGSFPYSVWQRYLKHFKNITILSREKEEIINSEDLETIGKLTLSSGNNTRFVGLPNLNSVRGKLLLQKKAKKLIENEMKEATALVARLPSEIGTLAIEVAISKNIPYITEVVGCTYDAYNLYGGIKGKVYSHLSFQKMRRVVSNSNFTIYVTDSYLQKKYPTKGNQINISNVQLSEVSMDIMNRRLLDDNKLSNDKTFKIGMIGSLNSTYKGFDKAIQYLSEVKPNNDNYSIHILGGGNKNNFDKVINDCNMSNKVIFDGTRSSGDGVFKWLDDIDLYIQPSLTEGLPRALIEAMSRGCLTIGSAKGGIPELLKKEFLFNPYDLNSFKKSIDYALKTEKKVQIEQNLKKAQEYTQSILFERRNNFIKEFIGKNNLLEKK